MDRDDRKESTKGTRGKGGHVILCVVLGLLPALPAAGSLSAQQADLQQADSLQVNPEPPSAVDAVPVDAPVPPAFEAAELARSRRCVPALSRVEAVASELDPLRRRGERIEALHRAVSVEDSLRVTPLADDDPLESAVRDWFRGDGALALEYLETEAEEVRERRQAQRRAMLDRLEAALAEVRADVEEILGSAGDLQSVLQDCEGRIFVRSAVLEACEDESSPVCEAAASEEPSGSWRFVERASDLWDIEQLRPWTGPSRILPTADGGLGGARTASFARRGNLALVVRLEPSIQRREALSQEAAAEFDRNLESLGFEFDHPELVMVPTLSFELDVPGKLGDETDYLLHFGDLSDPDADLVWRIPVPESGPAGAVFAASAEVLERLSQGEVLILTAARLPEGGAEGNAIFSLMLTNVGQSSAVSSLVQYMASGALAQDLATLVPPAEDAEP